MADIKDRRAKADARHRRQRKRVTGTAERPRLSVRRSNRHIYAQLVNDLDGYSLTGVSTLSPSVKEKLSGARGVAAAALVGKEIARLALSKDVKSVVFDRGGHLFHGQVKALADAAREGGLEF